MTGTIPPCDLTRVVIVGSTGAGKTTFARELSSLLAVPHIHLDELYWGADWTPVDKDLFVERVTHSVAEDRWVADGNYSIVRPLLWGRATTVIWLDYSFGFVFRRLLWRTVRRAATREELFAGNRESWRISFTSRDSILCWMITSWR